MQKLKELIEQVRFTELDKIVQMSKAQELYLKKEAQLNQESVNQ